MAACSRRGSCLCLALVAGLLLAAMLATEWEWLQVCGRAGEWKEPQGPGAERPEAPVPERTASGGGPAPADHFLSEEGQRALVPPGQKQSAWMQTGQEQASSVPRVPQCAANWTRLMPNGTLTGMHWAPGRPPRSFAGFKHGTAYQGLFFHPELRFAICMIEKNACTSWNQAMMQIVRSTFPDWLLSWQGFSSWVATERWGTEGMTKVFTDPGATKAVFVREPLARFASAFVDKCGGDCKGKACFPRTKAYNYQAIPFRLAVEWMLRQDPSKVDDHWKLQSAHCELRTRVKEYTVVGLMGRTSLAPDAWCVLEAANLTRFFRRAQNPFRATRNPSKMHQGGRGEEALMKRLFTPDAARRLIGHLAQDYKTFQFPAEPAWVAEATGEWYDTVPPELNCSTAVAPVGGEVVWSKGGP